MAERPTTHTHQATLDPETNTSFASSFQLLDTDTPLSAEALEQRLAMLDQVVWKRVAAINHRKWVGNEVRRFEQSERVRAFKSAGKKIDQQIVNAEEQSLNTAQWRTEVAIRTDAKLSGLDPDAVMAQLREEVTQHTKAA